uniref:Sel1 repeat-containing protein 1 n=1 Tax=Strongyloides stercoralis TaxID=6248 RepID=A0A0K0EF59_STRER
MSLDSRLTKEEFEKIQEERREYVKNIGIEYRFGCYKEKRADSCHLLGEWFEAIEQNFNKSFTLFKKNCLEKQYPKSCFKYGNYRLSGKQETPKKLVELIDSFKIACDGNVPPGCTKLGLIYWNGEEGRAPNPELAVKYMERACELEDVSACFRLSNWYRSSEEDHNNKNQEPNLGYVAKDVEKALSFAKIACELGDPNGCMHVCLMYRGKDGFPEDKEQFNLYAQKAKELFKMAKSANSEGPFTG